MMFRVMRALGTAGLFGCAAAAPVVPPTASLVQIVDSTRIPMHERFVLPSGYRGPFIAIYDQPSGMVPEWRGDTGVYPVPVDGVLRVLHKGPPATTTVSVVYADAPQRRLPNYPTCATMRVNAPYGVPSVCWMDFWYGGTGVPAHIAAAVTDWSGIPEHYNRTTALFDSLFAGGKGAVARKWSDPPEMYRRDPAVRQQ